MKSGDLAAKAQFRKALVESVEQRRAAIATVAREAANADVGRPGFEQGAPEALAAIEPVPALGEIGGSEAVEEFAGVDADTGEIITKRIGGVESDSQVTRLSGESQVHPSRNFRLRRGREIRGGGWIAGGQRGRVAIFLELAIKRGASDAE